MRRQERAAFCWFTADETFNTKQQARGLHVRLTMMIQGSKRMTVNLIHWQLKTWRRFARLSSKVASEQRRAWTETSACRTFLKSVFPSEGFLFIVSPNTMMITQSTKVNVKVPIWRQMWVCALRLSPSKDPLDRPWTALLLADQCVKAKLDYRSFFFFPFAK